MSDTISPEEADRLAALLNQICAATLDALRDGGLQQQAEVATGLRAFHEQFDSSSTLAPFVLILIRWLEGERPDQARVRELDGPFRRALQSMLQQVPTGGSEAEEPISRHVLAQLVSATVAASASQDEGVQRKLAAQLLNIQGKLEEPWRARLVPLLENLRAVLGGVDARTLPPVSDPLYSRFWHSAVELLIHADLSEEAAHRQLMERLVHNTRFVLRSQDEELSSGFLRTLMDVQRQSLQSNAPTVATLVSAIRAYLQGQDATPFASLLDGAELAAWQAILGSADPSSEAPA